MYQFISARSVCNKLDDFHSVLCNLSDNPFSIVCLTETWLNDLYANNLEAIRTAFFAVTNQVVLEEVA